MTRIWLIATAGAGLLLTAAVARSAPSSSEPAGSEVLGAGIERLCAGFLAAPSATPAAVADMAASAGFKPGAQGHYGSVGEPIAGAPAALAFHADSEAAAGATIEVFLTTVPTACQVRVSNDRKAWDVFEARMERHGGELLTSAPVTPETTYSHDVYVGGVTGLPPGYTLFVNRWIGAGAPKSGTWTMINVLSDTGAGG